MIFINYRRQISSADARAIELRLNYAFGKAFIDIDMERGRNFPDLLKEAVENSLVMVVIIGPGWSTVSDQQGQLRIHKEDDFVRLEIESAIHRKIEIVPVLIENAQMPSKAEIPSGLWPLLEKNAVHINHTNYPLDMGGIEIAVSRAIKRASRSAWIRARIFRKRGAYVGWIHRMAREGRYSSLALVEAEARARTSERALEVAREENKILQVRCAALHAENIEIRHARDRLQQTLRATTNESQVYGEILPKTANDSTLIEIGIPSLGHLGPKFRMLEWFCEEGVTVYKDQILCILDARGRKMEVLSPVRGRVVRLRLHTGVDGLVCSPICELTQ